MKNIEWFSRLTDTCQSSMATGRVGVGIGTAILLLTTGIASAQLSTIPNTTEMAPPSSALEGSTPVVQNGFVIHQSADLGGNVVERSGSGAMYDTLVNFQSGPRVFGQTFTMHAVPGTKHQLLDSLTAFISGFGGDPYNFAKLDFSKGKLYEFSGTFHRNRQYFDYDLLGNPNIPSGLSIPIGPSNAPTGSLAWPQMENSPEMMNTVRRMTNTNLTILPLSKVTFRFSYNQNVFQGPSLIPGPFGAVGNNTPLLEQYERNSIDDFDGAVDWKPIPGTKFTYEEEVTHYKENTYFTLNPHDFLVQEADGQPVDLGAWNSPTPYGISSCNTSSMGSAYTNSTAYTILSAPQTPGGKPILNPACDGLTSYLRSQPTRTIYPTEIFRFQTTSIKNIEMNGNFYFTKANTNLPNYYETFQGLDGSVRAATYTGNAYAQREAVGAEYGITWQLSKKFLFADQVYYSDVHEPGTSNISAGITANTPTTPGDETMTYSGPLVPGKNITVEGASNGTPLPDYFGQRVTTNNATVSWDVTPRTMISLTYRYSNNVVGEGIPNNAPLAPGADTNGTVTINQNGGILNVALHPTNHLDMSGTVEAIYNNNVLDPVEPRELQHYRFHSLYRPKPWASLSANYNDMELHNNTNNTGTTPIDGPLDHVAHSRIASLGTVLAPSKYYALDISYSFSDVYTSTNICYYAGATSTLPGAATASGTACPGATVRGSTAYEYGPVKDFMDAPTQYASVGLDLSPLQVLQADLGYTISSVSGNQFFNNAQEVNGSLQSAYQSPYVKLAWAVRPNWIWKIRYNYFGYGEGGPSGAPLCSNVNPTATTSAPGVPCTSSTVVGPTGLTEPSSGLTAPRNFHANLLVLSMHYEF